MPYQRFESYRDFLSSNWANYFDTTFIDVYGTEPSDKILNTPCLYIAWSDYSGTFLQRVLSQFLLKYVTDNPEYGYILREAAGFNGDLVVYIGELPTDDYPLADFPLIPINFEDFYSDKECEAESESFEYFIDCEFQDASTEYKEQLRAFLRDEYGWYYGLQSDGTLDFSWEDMRKKVIDELGEPF